MSLNLQTFLRRLFSTVILIAALAGVWLWNHPYGYAALICLLCNLSAVEWHCMLREHKRESNRWLILAAGLVYPWIIAWKTLEGTPGEEAAELVTIEYTEALAITIFAFKCLVGYALLAFALEIVRMDYRGLSEREALQSLGTTLVGFIFPVWMFSFALEALLEYPFHVRMLVWLVVATKLSDICAYVSGVLLGKQLVKRSFSPAVSPNKTWEGIVGSFILTAGSAWLLMEPLCGEAVMPAPLFFCLFMPALFVLSVVGDLAGSLIKRGLGVKDSGKLLPGIGGVFDLIDSPAFTVVAFVGLLGIVG